MSALRALESPLAALPTGAPTINLASVDLNLLVALEALLEHCNVTHAASTVGLSQPAMSRALSRLRGMFDDELLVRTSSGYVRTIRGEMLHDRLPITLDALRKLVSSRLAASQEWMSTVRVAMPDYQALVLMPQVLNLLGGGPTDVDIPIEPLTPNVLKRLENGELEMAIGQVSGTATGFFQRRLYADDYACLVRRDHPVLQEDWSAERFLELRHAVTPPGFDGERNHLAEALVNVPQRNHCLVSPNTMGAAMAVVESDMVLTVPSRVAVKMATILPLSVLAMPIRIEPYEVMLLWHERSHKNAEHGWIRSQIAAAAQAGPVDVADGA